MNKRQLTVQDIESLENTSFASAFAAHGASDGLLENQQENATTPVCITTVTTVTTVGPVTDFFDCWPGGETEDCESEDCGISDGTCITFEGECWSVQGECHSNEGFCPSVGECTAIGICFVSNCCSITAPCCQTGGSDDACTDDGCDMELPVIGGGGVIELGSSGAGGSIELLDAVRNGQ